MGVYDWNLATGVLWWSPEIYTVFGLDAEAFTPTPDSFTALVHADDRALFWERLQESFARREDFTHDFRILRPDGAELWISNRAQTEYGAVGEAVRHFGIAIDITRQKRAEEETLTRTHELETLLDALPAFVWIARDAGCRVITGNRAANELTATPSGTNVSQTAAQTGEGVYLKQLKEDGSEYRVDELPMQRAIALGKPVRDAVLDFRFPDGRTVQALGDAVPLLDDAGRPWGAVAAFVDITARKAAEEALRQSAARLRLAAQSAGFGTYDYDVPTGRLIWSKQLRVIMGVPERAEITKDLFFSLIHPEDLKKVEAQVAASFDAAGAGTHEHEFRVIRPDGEVRWLRDRGRTYFAESDGVRVPVRSLGTVVDATERKQADEARLRNETLFSTIIEQAPGGVYVIDDQFRMAAVNRNSRGVFAAAEPVIGRDFNEAINILWGPEVGAEVASIFRHTLESGEPYVSPEFTAHREDLNVDQSYEWETRRLTMPNGRFGVVCYYSDVTEQRRLEAALRASEQRAMEIIQSIDDGFLTMDDDWRITFLSARGAVILAPLQVSSSSVLGTTFWDQFPATIGTSFETSYRRAMDEKVAVHFEEYYRPLGRWFHVRAYPSAAGLSAYFLDITDRKEAEAALLRSQQELARQAEALRVADRSKDEFLAMLAHELRNPLAPMRNATELLETENLSTEESGHALHTIRRQIDNMSRMIDDLLDVSRITEGKISLRKEPVPIERVLTAAASLARSGCMARGQTLSVSMPAEPVYLNADATRLEQVFGNLLSNACKYSGTGTSIHLEAHREEGEIVVTVSDNGIGIEPAVITRIFDLFVQASRTLDRATGGLGIGLTLVQRLVKLHGGSVVAHSDGLGKGASFAVRLPVLDEVPPTPVPPPPTGRPEISRRILVVDDNTDSARTLAALQTRRGHVTRTAFTGPDALIVAAEFLPEVVLLDIGLPGMDGYAVARFLRAMPGMKDTLLNAMSGYGSPDDRALAKEVGFDDYLVKPVELETLRKLLRGAGE